ncbi:hypothetical protein V7O66_02140 [Methanolobus sp. ZRKC3]|uniref:hypothetical protein n=1 Tax=Methanolobus sp. ZRKC3 TaxID=3125786 RepID=UPI003249BFDA
MINNKKYGILLLQVSVILLAFMVVPVSANGPPIVLEGSLLVDGNPAVAGTEVTVVAEGNTVARTTVTNEGFFGDERSNRLGVSSIYKIVTMYVDGVEAQTLDLSGYNIGDVVSVDLTASSPAPVIDAGTKATTTGSSGGGGGGFSSASVGEEIETTSATEEVRDEPEETVLQSTSDDLGAEESEPVPVSTSQGSNAIVVLGIVLVVAVIGIYMYKSRK